MTIAIKKNKFILYFVWIAFLFPRGLSEYFSIYKLFATILLYGSILLTVVYAVARISKRKMGMAPRFFPLFWYYFVMIGITILVHGSLREGLQKMFATPALCLFCIMTLEDRFYDSIDVICNILITNLTLNVTVASPYILKKIMGSEYITNIMFIGHVQICLQYCCLAFFIAFIIYHYYNLKIKSIIIFLTGLLSLLLSGAVASYLAVAVIISCYIFYKLSKGRKFISKANSAVLFALGTLLQGLVVLFVIIYKIDFAARYYVYIDAASQIIAKPFIGYGIYGTLIHTFWMEWTNSSGMNYAHNEVLQQLLDGGILLLINYVIFNVALLRKKKNEGNDTFLMYWTNILLVLFLIDGFVESVTEYNYYYIFIILIVSINQYLRKNLVEVIYCR